MGRRRLRGVLSWRSSPGSRERPPVATMVANQASDTARTLGLDAANRRGITQFSQQRAKTHSPTGTTCNARKPKCSWAGTDNDPGGTAPACWLGENFGSPQKIDTGSALKSRLNGFFRPRAAPALRRASQALILAARWSRAQEEEPIMSRLAFALVLAVTSANAQDTKSEQSQTPAVASTNGTRPFLFDGRMPGDGVRQGAPARDHLPNDGAIIMPPKASQPERER